MIETVSEAVKNAMFRPINKSASVILGITSLVWGFWVANPFWRVFDSAQVYYVLNALAPEWMWGLIPMLIGIGMIVGIAKSRFTTLLASVRIGFYFWFFTSLCFFIGDWQNTAGIIYSMVTLYCGYVALNLSINREYYLEQGPNVTSR